MKYRKTAQSNDDRLSTGEREVNLASEPRARQSHSNEEQTARHQNQQTHSGRNFILAALLATVGGSWLIFSLLTNSQSGQKMIQEDIGCKGSTCQSSPQ